MEPTPEPQQTAATQAHQQGPTQYAPAWYPDPTNRFEFRYHNGQIWTGDVSVDGHRYLDPLSMTSSPLQTQLPLVLPQQHASGKSIAAFVLAISSVLVGWVPFLCVLAVAAAVLAVIFGFSSLARMRREGHSRGRRLAMAAIFIAPVGFAVSGVGIWLTVLTVREFDRYSNVGEYSVETTRCAVDSGIAHFDGTIVNSSNTSRSYHLVVEFLRAGTGNTLYSTHVDVESVEPGKSRDWSIRQPVTQETIDCRVSSVTGPLPFTES